MDARQELILAFSFGGLFLGILILYVAFRIKAHITRVGDKVDDLHSVTLEGAPAADASQIRADIKAMRVHMMSNHDEIDGELRSIAGSSASIASEMRTANHRAFEKEVREELERARAPKEDTQ